LLLGSSAGLVLARWLVAFTGFRFASTQIIAVSEELARVKTFDIFDFAFAFIFTLVFFVFNRRLVQKSTSRFANYYYLALSAVIFIQTHFFDFSSGNVVLMIFFTQAVYWWANRVKTGKIKLTAVLFGIAAYFAAGFVFNYFWWPLFISLLAAFFYQAYIKFDLPKRVSLFLIVVFLSFNPYFYIGNFDSVEEGFWAAWIQRLGQGEVLYKDVATYYPPLVIWGLSFFTRVFGSTIYNQRLFFHIFEIFGFYVLFLLIRKVVKKPVNYWAVLFLALSFAFTSVRNNVMVRLLPALLSLLFFKSPFLAGAMGGLSLFTSMEVGLALIPALLVSFPLKKFIRLGAGYLLVMIPIVLILIFQGALSDFVSQTFFYSKAFSLGYFNTPVERAITTEFFHWHLFYQYLGTTAAMWEVVRGVLLLGLIIVVGMKNKLVFSMIIFSLLLFRVYLGRSDWYHLLFVALPALPVLFYLIEKWTSKVGINVALIFLFLFVLGGQWTLGSESFLSKKLVSIEKFGRAVGSYQPFNLERAKVLVGSESNVNDISKTVGYIKDNTTVNETIFVFPWGPEIYFLADRKNATRFDTPYSFFSNEYQKEMVDSLKEMEPKLIVYEPNKRFGNLSPKDLELINSYIVENYIPITYFDTYVIYGKDK